MSVRQGILHRRRHAVVDDAAPADEERYEDGYDDGTGQVVTDEERPRRWPRHRRTDDVVDDAATDQPVAERPVVERPVVERPVVERPVADDADRTVVVPVAEQPASPGWARVSMWATLGMIVSLVGLGATLTGLLAPEGFALGVIGLLISLAGMVGASRRGVTGHSLAIIGILAGAAAIVLAVMAMTGDFSWPNSRTDEVARAHHWLVAHWSWLGRWS